VCTAPWRLCPSPECPAGTTGTHSRTDSDAERQSDQGYLGGSACPLSVQAGPCSCLGVGIGGIGCRVDAGSFDSTLARSRLVSVIVGPCGWSPHWLRAARRSTPRWAPLAAQPALLRMVCLRENVPSLVSYDSSLYWLIIAVHCSDCTGSFCLRKMRPRNIQGVAGTKVICVQGNNAVIRVAWASCL
jgi:hypothetical protein